MDRLHSRGLVLTQSNRLKADFGLCPVVASELEFYLSEDAGEPFWREVAQECRKAGIGIFKTEKERGQGQHEIALAPTDAITCAAWTRQVKVILSGAAAANDMRADFSAKPYPDQPGSGLHIHVHLADASGKNTFHKDDAAISDSLKYSIGGLLAWLPDCLPVFAPAAESYRRFVPEKNTPLTVSWGANNRTVAVRLPDSEKHNKRIEHRVPGADCDPDAAIAAILAAMHYGLKHRTEPGEQMYGEANLAMYGMPKFPHTMEEAAQRMRASKMMADYFSAADLLPDRK